MPNLPSPCMLSQNASPTSTVSSTFSAKNAASNLSAGSAILTVPSSQRALRTLHLPSTVTTRGCPKSPREDSRRTRAHSFYSSSSRSRSPLRSPEVASPLFESALSRAGNETVAITEEIISRQTEINERQHDIAVWKRKIQAAEKLITSMQQQVKALVEEARDKQDAEKELAGQSHAMLSSSCLTERELHALQLTLSGMTFGHNGKP